MTEADRKIVRDAVDMETLVSLCKRRGIIFQSSEIYGGINGFWDFGPVGCELKRRIKDSWWKRMVQDREDVVGIDTSIIAHPQTWIASGHVASFNDPMVDCKACKRRFRADDIPPSAKGHAAGVCPECGGELTAAREFNLMFQTHVGATADSQSLAYLRPETCQSIFTEFKNVQVTARQKVPFGIAQIGKAFRNEINPRNYIFRSREFEQMELEFFIPPGQDERWHGYWVEERMRWYQAIGIPEGRLHRYAYPKEELAHYASACVDVLYDFPFGTQELEGIAARGDFDLSRHQEFSGKSLEYFNPDTQERFLPHVVEPSAGVDRIALAVLCEAYREEWIPKGEGSSGVRTAEAGAPVPDGFEARTVLRFAPCLAPVKAAVFPLLKNKPELVERARRIHAALRRRWPVFYDQTGAIGRRYRRQDEIGTPFGITVDFQTLDDGTVTLRDRDTMAQVRVPEAELAGRIEAAVELP